MREDTALVDRSAGESGHSRLHCPVGAMAPSCRLVGLPGGHHQRRDALTSLPSYTLRFRRQNDVSDQAAVGAHWPGAGR